MNVFVSPEGRKYNRLNLGTSSGYDFRIVVVDPPGYQRRCFIVPAIMLLEKKIYYIPAERTPIYPTNPPKIDWWEYENAWHLIKA